MKDVIGAVIIELREDADTLAILGEAARVRGQEVGKGDSKAPKDWVPHIKIVTLTTPRLKHRVPVQNARYAIHCFGRSKEEAAALYAAASDALEAKGPREATGGYWIYVSHDVSGGSYFVDPDTRQPAYTFVLELLATTQAVTV